MKIQWNLQNFSAARRTSKDSIFVERFGYNPTVINSGLVSKHVLPARARKGSKELDDAKNLRAKI